MDTGLAPQGAGLFVLQGMDDDKPVPTRRIGFVVSQEGAVVPWQPPQPPAPPARPLNRDERVDAYRAGIRHTTDALREMGFAIHYTAEHTTSAEFRGYLFDFRIQRPDHVAHIGGTPGPKSTKGTHGGSIYKLSDEIQSEFALQMIIGKEFSARPLYVALDENLPDPAKTIYNAVMGFLASLNDAQHRLGKATVGKHPQLCDTGPAQLPEWIDARCKP